jgi:multidrug efflux pump subunit AcrA (membrane-fusion protein)
MIEKPGKFASSQDIVVTSQANWKVSAIYFKEWQEVKWGQPVIALSDTIASYKLQVDNAKNTLDRAILTKQQTELQINQQIESAKNAYENAQKGFDLAKKSSEISVKQVKNSVSSADSSVDTLRNSFLALKNWTLNYLDTVIDTSDALLGVSQYYEDNLDKGIEVYVWAKDASKKKMQSNN